MTNHGSCFPISLPQRVPRLFAILYLLQIFLTTRKQHTALRVARQLKITLVRIVDICIRQSPIGRFGVISIAEGFVASDIRRQFMEGQMKHRLEGPSQSVPSSDDIIDLTLEDSSSEKSQDNRLSPTVGTRSSIVIGAEQDDFFAHAQDEQPPGSNVSVHVSFDEEESMPGRTSPIIISSDSEDDGMQIPEEAEGTLSPALSYLTLDQLLSNAYPLTNVSTTPSVDISDSTRRWGWNCDDSQSSVTSAEDSSTDEAQTGNPPATVGDETSGMDLIKQRLVTGGNVEEILDELPPEQRRRIQDYLEVSATSCHRSRINRVDGKSKWVSASSFDS